MSKTDKQIDTDSSIASILKAYAVRVYKAIVPSKTDRSILDTQLKFSDRTMHVDKDGFLTDSDSSKPNPESTSNSNEIENPS